MPKNLGLIALIALLILSLGAIGFLLFPSDSPPTPTPEAKIEQPKGPEPAPVISLGRTEKAEEQPEQPSSLAEEVVEPVSTEGMTELTIAFDAPEDCLDTIGGSGRLTFHTADSLAELHSIHDNDSEGYARYWEKYKGSQIQLDFEGTSTTINVEARYQYCEFRVRPKFKSGFLLPPAEVLDTKGRFVPHHRNPNLSWGHWHFAKPKDKITLRYDPPASLQCQILAHGKTVSPRPFSVFLVDPEQEHFSLKAKRLNSEESPDTFVFPNVPTGRALKLAVRVDFRRDDDDYMAFPELLRFHQEVKPLAIGEARKGVKIPLPVVGPMHVRILGDQMAGLDWHVSYQFFDEIENGSGKHYLDHWSRSNQATTRGLTSSLPYTATDRFPLKLNDRVMEFLIKEARRAKAMGPKDFDFARFATFMRSHTSELTLNITFNCFGYMTYTQEINAAEVFRMFLDGVKTLEITPVKGEIEGAVRVLDRATGQPIANAKVASWHDSKIGEGVFTDSEGYANVRAPGIYNRASLIVIAEGYLGEAGDLQPGNTTTIIELDWDVKAKLEVFLTLPDGSPLLVEYSDLAYRFAAVTSFAMPRDRQDSGKPHITFTRPMEGRHELLIAVKGYRPVSRWVEVGRLRTEPIQVTIQLEREELVRRKLELAEYFKRIAPMSKKMQSLFDEEEGLYLSIISGGDLDADAIRSLQHYQMKSLSTGEWGVIEWRIVPISIEKPSTEVTIDSKGDAWLLGQLGEFVPLVDDGTTLRPDFSRVGRVRGKVIGPALSEIKVHLVPKARIHTIHRSMDLLQELTLDLSDGGKFEFPCVSEGDYLLITTAKRVIEGTSYAERVEVAERIPITLTGGRTAQVSPKVEAR